MIDFINVTKQFGSQEVFSDVSFRINTGEHVGVVGPNGAGKSTVFKLITGELRPDKGEIMLPKNVRTGHLHQQLKISARDNSLIDYTCNAVPELKQITSAILELEQKLPGANGSEKQKMLQRLGGLQHEFENLGGYDIKSRAEAALSGLGFKESEFSNSFRSFSGGWQMRAELVRALVSNPDILLLDEPSNYLDIPAVEWLQRYLRGFAGTMLMISHDRYLLESLTDKTLEISAGSALKYPGGYSYYIKERRQRRMQQEAAYKNYTEQKERLESFINRFRAKATKAAQVQSRVKMLEKLDAIRPPAAQSNLSKLRIPPPPHCGAHVVSLENAGFSYDGIRWIFRNLNMEIGRGTKIALVGYNGMGKTTLLRVLAGALSLQEGTRREGHKVKTGYQSQDFAETMPPDKNLLNTVREANPAVTEREARNLLGSFGFSGDDVEKRSGVLSGGEKIRLAFARIFINPPNFLLLDEPTTNLDIHGREALEKAVRDYTGTVCFVSHDIAFVRNAADHITAISSTGVKSYPGGYDYYLEKTVGTPDAAATPAMKTTAAANSEGAAKKSDLRKARALEREAGKKLKTMESEMEKLHAEQRGLHEKLASGEPDLDYQALKIELADTSKKLNKLEALWLEEADRLGI